MMADVTCPYCRNDVFNDTYCSVCGGPLSPHETNPQGHRIGPYFMERLLAAGANGRLYCAKHVGTEQLVALKLLHPQLLDQPKSIRRLRREAEIGIRLQHPHAVKLFEFGVDPTFGIFLVMELIVGDTLYQLLQDEGPLEVDRALSIALQICEVLDKAHHLQIVHRDLKPSNVMLKWHPTTKDFVKVCDFGMAKIATYDHTETQLTMPGTVHGTPGYMAPEQCRGAETTTSTDIYTLGVLLYEMLTGILPYRGRNIADLLKQQMMRTPYPIRDIRPELASHPEIFPLERIVRRCLEKEPNDRYPNMEQLRQDLANALPSYTPLEIVLEDQVEAIETSPHPPTAYTHRWVSLSNESWERIAAFAQQAPQRLFLPDQRVFQEGQTPTHFSLIAEGEVRLLRRDEKRIIELDRLGPGHFLGVSAFFSNSSYTMTAVATERTQLHILEPLFFNPHLSHSPELQTLFQELYREYTLQRLIRYTPFFATLAPEHRYALLQQGHLLSYGPQQVIVEPYSMLDSLYLVATGSVRYHSSTSSSFLGDEPLLAGDCIGEAQLLSQQLTEGTYVTQTNTSVLQLPFAALQPFLQPGSHLRQYLQQLNHQRLAERISQSASPEKTAID
ncbi:MAG: cyclic nucleotide-binding domain-containing protein [Deltaproteobacteria bacterium]|nr:MAG: cyclic nucleotide-binding domain-containing protein [Deltaproteobacteria bacterium]